MATHHQKAKNWCFTLNNPTIDENEIVERFEASQELQYLVFQMEAGQQGTPHYQGYVILSARKRLAFLKEILREAHWEVAKGTPKQNRDYCTKPDGRIGEPVEVGIFPETGQGKRSDLAELHSALKNGLRQDEYRDLFFEQFIRYPNLVENYCLAGIKPRSPSERTRCVLYLGPPGTGKSTLADAHARSLGLGVFRKSPGRWWDGYRGEKAVVFDDFRGSSLSFTDFKLTVDRFPLRVEVKGSTCEMAATWFFITTNTDPRDWWDETVTQKALSAITRRITEVYYMPELNKYKYYPTWEDFEREHPYRMRPPEFLVLSEIEWQQHGTQGQAQLLRPQIQEQVQEVPQIQEEVQ